MSQNGEQGSLDWPFAFNQKAQSGKVKAEVQSSFDLDRL